MLADLSKRLSLLWVRGMTRALRRWAKNSYAQLIKWRWQWVYANKPTSLAAMQLPHAGLHPFIWVDPSKLGFKCKLDTKRVYKGLLFMPGEWDQPRITVNRKEQKDPRYQSCR